VGEQIDPYKNPLRLLPFGPDRIGEQHVRSSPVAVYGDSHTNLQVLLHRPS